MSDDNKTVVGWIGTGVMGASMVRNLMAAGYALRIYSRTRAKAADLEAAGAVWADSAKAAAEGADVVCVMVGYPQDVEEQVLGEQGALAGMAEGSLLIDFTSSSPALAVRIAEEAAARGVASLDAPVSGGDVGARDGTLSIMVGGSDDAFARAAPLFDVVGKTIVLQGPAGAGQHTKLVNQIAVAGSMISVVEMLLYTRAAGLDPETVLQSVGSGAAASWTLSNYTPRILVEDYEPGFYVEHFIKDMNNALAECTRMGITLPGLQLVHRLYERLAAMGHGRKGTQALILALEGVQGESAGAVE